MNPTPIQQKLDADFAALFGPVTPPTHLPPQELKDESQSRGPHANL